MFDVLASMERAGEWMPGFVRFERLEGPASGVGVKWRETRKMFGREASEVFEVTGMERAKSIDLFVDGTQGSSRRGYYEFRYELAPAGAGTHVTLNGEIGGMGRIGEIFGRLFVGPMKKAIAKDLAAMKACVEKQPSA